MTVNLDMFDFVLQQPKIAKHLVRNGQEDLPRKCAFFLKRAIPGCLLGIEYHKDSKPGLAWCQLIIWARNNPIWDTGLALDALRSMKACNPEIKVTGLRTFYLTPQTPKHPMDLRVPAPKPMPTYKPNFPAIRDFVENSGFSVNDVEGFQFVNGIIMVKEHHLVLPRNCYLMVPGVPAAPAEEHEMDFKLLEDNF